MTIIATPPPRLPMAEVSPYSEISDASYAFSPEGYLLSDRIRQVRTHWQEHSSANFEAQDEVADSLGDVHFPFKSVGQVRMRLLGVGKLKPRVLDPDEDMG